MGAVPQLKASDGRLKRSRRSAKCPPPQQDTIIFFHGDLLIVIGHPKSRPKHRMEHTYNIGRKSDFVKGGMVLFTFKIRIA
jgi:hypothetical protein